MLAFGSLLHFLQYCTVTVQSLQSKWNFTEIGCSSVFIFQTWIIDHVFKGTLIYASKPLKTGRLYSMLELFIITFALSHLTNARARMHTPETNYCAWFLTIERVLRYSDIQNSRKHMVNHINADYAWRRAGNSAKMELDALDSKPENAQWTDHCLYCKKTGPIIEDIKDIIRALPKSDNLQLNLIEQKQVKCAKISSLFLWTVTSSISLVPRTGPQGPPNP